jgi:acyl-CoA reductase-like NAD-dependent aldehyde dehydrogenase
MTLNFIPMGVVGAITPWNFPLVLSVAKVGAALITGNCVIVKPSPFTPYTILKFAEIAQQVLPAGVLQALQGDEKIGPLMTEHPGIAKISFTESSAIGKKIMAAASKTLKSVTLELARNSASVICPDVDVESVAAQVAVGSFFNSGQFCMASKRIYVHKDIYPQFLKAITAVVQSWKVGPASERDIMLGPVQNEMQYNIVKSFFKDTVDNGYKFAIGGGSEVEDGYIIKPAIIDNPPDNSKIVTEEPFGKR